MDIQSEKDRCERAEKQISLEREIIRGSMKAVALHDCPFEVGERVINHQGEEEEICSISFSSWPSSHSPRCYSFKVYKIKKNGELFVNSSNVYFGIDKYTKA